MPAPRRAPTKPRLPRGRLGTRFLRPATAPAGGGGGAIPTLTVGTPVDGTGAHVTSPPGGTVQNDLLLGYCWLDINTSTVATPSGWTLLHGPIDSASTADCRLYVFAKLAGAGEGTTTFTDALGGRDWTSVIVGVHGNVTTALGTGNGDGAVDRTATNTPASGTTAATASVTPTVNNCLIIGVAHGDLSATSTPHWTPPGSWTEDLDRENATSFVNGTVAHIGQTTAAAISGTFTAAVSDEHVTHIVAVAPAPAGGLTVGQAVEVEAAQAMVVVGGNQFPATIGGIHPESNNRMGPFIDGNGNLYTVTELTVANPNPCMRKSTNGGVSWAEVDSANRPTHDDLESLWIEQRSTVLYLLYQRSGTMRVTHCTFNTSDAGASPDTWQVKDEQVHLPGTAPANQAVSLAVRSNGDLLAFYRTDPVSTFQRVAWRKKPSGGSWSSETQVDTTASTNFTQVAVVVGASDKVHIFYKDDTNSNVLHKSLTSADSLSSSAVVNDNATTTDDQMMATPPIYVDVAGTERVYAAWKRLSTGFLVGAAIDDDGTPAAEEAISSVAVWEDPAVVISEQSVATLAPDPATGKIYALYADNATHDLWRVVRNGNWTGETETLDAVEVQYVAARVFTHGTPGGSKRVLGIIFDDNPTGQTDAGVPKYTQVLLGLPPLGQATETEAAQAVGRVKTAAAAQAVETETAQAVTVVKTRAAGQATETEAAQAVGHLKTRAVAQAVETEQAQAVTGRKTVAVVQAVEVEAAQAVTVSTVAQVVLSAPVPYNMVAELGIITIGQAVETETAQAVPATRIRTAAQAVETEAAQAVGKAKTKAVAQAVEAEAAQTISRPGAVSAAVEVETAQTVTAVKTKAAGQAVETETAQAIGHLKVKAVGQVVETEQAQAVVRPGSLSQAVETEAAQAVAVRKTRAVGQATETESAQTVAAVEAKAVTQATETESAQAVVVRKTRAVGQAVEVEQAQTIARLGHLFIAVNQATEVETAFVFGRVKLKTLAQAAEAEAAQALTKKRSAAVNPAVEVEEAQAVTAVGGVPPPRWVEGVATAAGMVEGAVKHGGAALGYGDTYGDTYGDDSPGLVEATVGGVGVIEGTAGI